MTELITTDIEKKEKDYDILMIGIVVLFVVVGLWFGTYFLLRGKDPTIRGTFGDMFGAVNALFSGLAFGGIILTILLQRKELTLQRKELEDTRVVLERTAKSQERSEKALARQAENLKASASLSALSTLLNHYHETAKATHITDGATLKMLHGKKEHLVYQIEAILNKKEDS